jgi:hypothetical protein
MTRLRLVAVLTVLSTILAGCAAPVKNTDVYGLGAKSDFNALAAAYLAQGKPSYNRDNLLEVLEAAKAFHDAGMWRLSNEALDRASELMPWKADKIDSAEEVLRLVGTTLTSSNAGKYTGKIFEGSLVDYYRSLNDLMLADFKNAQVSLNRLEQRQINAVDQFSAFVRGVDQSNRKDAADNRNRGYSQSLERSRDATRQGVAAIDASVRISEIRNSAGDALTGIVRATSPIPELRNASIIRTSLTAASSGAASTAGRNLAARLNQELGDGRTATNPLVVVIYEDGFGPFVSEFRIDLPLFLVSDKVLYSGIALPKFNRGRLGMGSILVSEAKVPTALMVDMNRIKGLEFQKAYEGVVAKAVASTLVKTAAQYAANAAIDERVRQGKMSEGAGALAKILTATTQAALTNADTRYWRNLPNSIQMAVVPWPSSGILPIFSSTGQVIANISMPQRGNHVVLARNASPGAPLSVRASKVN